MGNIEKVDLNKLAQESETKAKIVSLDVKTGKEIFGEKAKAPEKLMLVILTDKHGEGSKGDVISMPNGLEFKNGKFIKTDEAGFARSITNKQSRMGKFVKAYDGYLPKVGLEVTLFLDENSFYKLKV